MPVSSRARERRLSIGTRGSPLALAQASLMKAAIESHHPGIEIRLRVIKTSGDRFRDGPLSSVGGKGLFVKEIEEALLDGSVDVAVHSMKDLPAEIPDGLMIAAVPSREDPRDVFIARSACGIDRLPVGARVGTTSLRRGALVRARRADLHVIPLRGNVDTRLRKLEEKAIDAVVLAAAGLKRLGLSVNGVPLEPEFFVPAIGQGALAIETRADETRTLVAELDDADSRDAAEAERAFMRAAGGSCHTPLAAYATVEADAIDLRAVILSPDGSRSVRGSRRGPRSEAEHLGEDLARELLAGGGAAILRAIGVGV